MASTLANGKANFGTLPVFLTALSTILGAILFLRFGYAVGHVGFWGTLGIILIGHLVTIPTALAVAEIATNQKVQGGGAYFIISRSFGLNIGGAIGIALYLSQAISVAFYILAFGEAFQPLLQIVQDNWGIVIPGKVITLSSMAIISMIMLIHGANMGMKALYIVCAILFFSLSLFFMGRGSDSPKVVDFAAHIENPDPFFYVFTIVFPAFTGLAAGLGLSGDLRDPQHSIPRGTIGATLVGIVIYVLTAYKLAISVTPEDMAGDQLIMQRIALWGPIIPIGLAAASLSSALGSVMVAPRTLQAVGLDGILPNNRLNRWLAKGREGTNEPLNGSIITILIAFSFIIIGDVNFVAEIISMFFMFTYGAICLISFLEYFAADPSFRPTFKQNRWYFSLLGAVLSFWLMFKMNWPYALLSLIIMAIIYFYISVNKSSQQGLQKLFRGVLFQIGRQLQVFVQRVDKEEREVSWRPFLICISEASFKRRAAFDLLRWISYRYGFGTYIHFIHGFLTRETYSESRKVLDRLLKIATAGKNRVYLDTIISPSYTSAIAQVIQLNSISGKRNNTILFEFAADDPDALRNSIENFEIISAAGFDVCILNSSYKGFGNMRDIHIWITPDDFSNANLMVLLGYIIIGHPEWSKGCIKIFALFPKEQLMRERKKILEVIKSGRLPISPSNVNIVPREEEMAKEVVISSHSQDADLTIVGFTQADVEHGLEFFSSYNSVGNVLFVKASRRWKIS